MTIWNNAKTRWKHLTELRAMILGLNKQIETQAETIKKCYEDYAKLAVKYNDHKRIQDDTT